MFEPRGPATKLIPALRAESDPETILITIDDDVFYPPSLVQELVDARSHPFPSDMQERASVSVCVWLVSLMSPTNQFAAAE